MQDCQDDEIGWNFVFPSRAAILSRVRSQLAERPESIETRICQQWLTEVIHAIWDFTIKMGDKHIQASIQT